MEALNQFVNLFKPSESKTKEKPKDEVVEIDDGEIYETDVDIYLLFNPLSGSKEGKEFADVDPKRIRYKLEVELTVQLTLVNIIKKEEMARAKDDIKQSVFEKADKVNETYQISRNVIVVICGGDGTFMNILHDFRRYSIDVDKIVFCPLPFGTANDICRNFGWGATPSSKMKNDLKFICNELVLHSKEQYFDVWEITVKLKPDTGFIETADGEKLNDYDTQHFKRLMCHSISIGADAKTGLGFEKQRTSNRFLNKMAYGLIGAKNYVGLSRTKTYKVKEILKSFNKLKRKDDTKKSELSSDEVKKESEDENQKEAEPKADVVDNENKEDISIKSESEHN